MPKQDSEGDSKVDCSLAGGVNAPPFSLSIIAFFGNFCHSKVDNYLYTFMISSIDASGLY